MKLGIEIRCVVAVLDSVPRHTEGTTTQPVLFEMECALPFFAFFVVLLFFDAMVGSNSSSGAGPG